MENMHDEQISEKENESVQKVTEVEKADISLGKFKDVNALLNAYNSLQSEFTKRCQRIKELEGASSKEKRENVEDTTSTETVPNLESRVETEEKIKLDKEEYLKEYLKSLLSSKQKAVIIGENGTSVKTPDKKPKTIAEAGLLAKEIL
jgi:hypothetical protein